MMPAFLRDVRSASNSAFVGVAPAAAATFTPCFTNPTFEALAGAM
jgi:hypothetical protein